jgi:hypothetical protein
MEDGGTSFLNLFVILILRIWAQLLIPEYRRTATSTGNILVMTNSSGYRSRHGIYPFLFASREYACGSDKLLNIHVSFTRSNDDQK